MSAFLVPVDPNQCLIPLEKAVVLIGRQADCDVSLTHSRKISRKHCCIAQVNHKYLVRDLGSTNGVFLNGNRIEKEAFINIGDDLIIGDVHFRVESEAPGAEKRNGAKKFDEATQNGESTKSPSKPPPIPVRPPAPIRLIANSKEASPNLDIPIAIPEGELDFEVETTRIRRESPRRRSRVDDVVPIDDDDDD